MKLYEGKKQIKATPMTRQAYNDYRGWELPEDEDGSDEGFLVEYLDGGKANHPDHKGYISWSPKVVFERAYTPIDTFLQRLELEKKELKEKLDALKSFLDSEKLDGINLYHKELLFEQKDAMGLYLSVLNERLTALGE